MRNVKVATIVGARPQFIKAALVSKRLLELGIPEVLVHTGQHYDFAMSDVFFAELHLPAPEYHLEVGSASHGEQTGKMLAELERTLLKEKPQIVLVYGDTNTTLAGSLAAAKLHVPTAHIEAGLRSYNRAMPEELNRVVADHVCDILFCPSERAAGNLRKEGFTNQADAGKLIDAAGMPDIALTPRSTPMVLNVGDVMFDLFLETRDRIDEGLVLAKFGLQADGFILVTIHRPENTDDPERLKAIRDSLQRIAADTGLTLFFPVHPRTRKALQEAGLLHDGRNDLRLHEPLSYKETLALETNARLVITDSGGVQKEAYFSRTQCVIPRGESEWAEIVEAGWAQLTGADVGKLGEIACRMINQDRKPDWKPYYGDGRAVDRIVAAVEQALRRSSG